MSLPAGDDKYPGEMSRLEHSPFLGTTNELLVFGLMLDDTR